MTVRPVGLREVSEVVEHPIVQETFVDLLLILSLVVVESPDSYSQFYRSYDCPSCSHSPRCVKEDNY